MRRNIGSGSPYEDVFGYSRAVRVGNTVHVSGTGADAERQARSALAVIEQSLAEAGASVADVVRTVTYVTDIADMELVARAHHELFGEVRPAATLVEVSALIDPAFKVEIEAYAIVDDDR